MEKSSVLLWQAMTEDEDIFIIPLFCLLTEIKELQKSLLIVQCLL